MVGEQMSVFTRIFNSATYSYIEPPSSTTNVHLATCMAV